MSKHTLRSRAGLGPGVDPHLDARLGRLPSSSAGAPRGRITGTGYLELVGDRAHQDLINLVRVVHGDATVPPSDFPENWGLISRLRYLTTDPIAGVALPLHSFNPGQCTLADALKRLNEFRQGKLGSARQIGLTLEFDLSIQRVSRMDTALKATQAAPRARDFWARQLGASFGISAKLTRAMREISSGSPSNRPRGAGGYGLDASGKDVIVGVVDFGCDFAHPSFRSGGGSRILALWDQNGDPQRLPRSDPVTVTIDGQTFDFGYGRLFTKQRIDQALESWAQQVAADLEAPYQLLGYHPHEHHFTSEPLGSGPNDPGAHGTAVMEVAVGAERDPCLTPAGTPPDDLSKVRGVAPEAEIVFVHVRQHMVDGVRTLDANDVIDAAAFVFHIAEERGRPCVVNLSLNTMSGPHDGDGYFERRLSSLLRSGRAGAKAQGRAVVVAAGNLPAAIDRGRLWQHLTGSVQPGQTLDFHLGVNPGDRTRNSVEIWYQAQSAWLQVKLTPLGSFGVSDGQPLQPVGPGKVGDILVDGRPLGSIVGSRLRPAIVDNAAAGKGEPADADTTAGRHVVLIELEPEVNIGVSWRITLEVVDSEGAPATSGPAIEFHAWLERDDEGQAGLTWGRYPEPPRPEDLACTVGTLSCGADPIVVSAYDTTANEVRAAPCSAFGPGRKPDIRKPDLAAPGHRLSLIRSAARGCRQQTGTSFAAPFVTGTIACLYQKHPLASLDTVREALIETARHDQDVPPRTWNSVHGYGRLDAAAALRWIDQHAASADARSDLPAEPDHP